VAVRDPAASPSGVIEAVKLKAFKPGGGHVFHGVHNIQAGVPPENVVAMFDAAWEHGWHEPA
jgi:uroporphyrinogen decarboxylase